MIKSILNTLSLFTSLSTLVCCALPALFVSLGFGAAFAGLIGTFPQLIWISENKFWLFAGGGSLLMIAGALQWRAQFEPCPVDPQLAKACMQTRAWSRRLYFFSLAIYLVGFFFAFLAPRLLG